MGTRGPAAPPGGGSTGPGGGQARLGQTGGGSGVSSGGGTSGGQEPTPMDMSIGPQPSQPMSAPHGMPNSVIYRIYSYMPYKPTVSGLILTIKLWRSAYMWVMLHSHTLTATVTAAWTISGPLGLHVCLGACAAGPHI